MKIVLVHGALGTASDFDSLGASLTERGFECICLPLSGHGKNDFNHTFSIAGFSTALHTLIRDFSPKNTLLFGYSMGGYVILDYLSRQPETAFPFMTLATKWHWNPEIAAKEKTLCTKHFLLEKAPQFYASLNAKHQHCDTLLERTASLIESLGTAVPPDVKSITGKGKIMRGTLDKMVSEEESRALQVLLPNAIFEALPDIKHPFDTVPTEVIATKISDFAKAVLAENK